MIIEKDIFSFSLKTTGNNMNITGLTRFLIQGGWRGGRPLLIQNQIQPQFRINSSNTQEHRAKLDVWLPPRKEPTQVLWVPGLLYEVVDLSAGAELHAILHPLQLLVQPQQHPLSNAVPAVRRLMGGVTPTSCNKYSNIVQWVQHFTHSSCNKYIE